MSVDSLSRMLQVMVILKAIFIVQSHFMFSIIEGYCDDSGEDAPGLALSGTDESNCAALDMIFNLSGWSASSVCWIFLVMNLNSPTIKRTPSFFSKHSINNLLCMRKKSLSENKEKTIGKLNRTRYVKMLQL